MSGDPAHATPYEMSDHGQPLNSVSRYLRFTYDRDARDRLRVYAHTTGGVLGPFEVGSYAVCEFTEGLGRLRGGISWASRLPVMPVETRADVDALLSAVRRQPNLERRNNRNRIIAPEVIGGAMPDGYPRRHQWPVIGGQSLNDDPRGFKPYLQLCLENGTFDPA